MQHLRLFGFLIVTSVGWSGDLQTTGFEVVDGVASFSATTNMSAISVHGKSQRLTAHASAREEQNQLVIEKIDAQLDPASLSTGMGQRDRHMREKVFMTPNGGTPELRFHAENIKCPVAANGQQTTCEISGTFSLREVTRPFRMNFRLRPEGNPANYRALADGVIRLSDFGLEPPSQFGIRVNDDVAVRLEFVARRQTGGRASR